MGNQPPRIIVVFFILVNCAYYIKLFMNDNNTNIFTFEIIYQIRTITHYDQNIINNNINVDFVIC